MGAMSIITRDTSRASGSPDHSRPPGAPSAAWHTDVLRSRLARAARAGAEAAGFSWLCAVVPALAAYAATAALPALGDATWTQAAAVGAGMWRLAQGAPVHAGDGITVTVVPLGLSLLCALLVAWSVRRAGATTWAGAAGAVAGYAASAAVLSLVAPTGPRQPLAVLPGAVVIASAGALLALGRRRRGLPELPDALRLRLDRLPPVLGVVVPEALRAAGRVVLALLGLGAVVAVVALASSTVGFTAVLDGLRIDRVSSVVVVLAALALLPTWVVWGVSWLAGPGFAVGLGTVYAPDGVVSGPLPAFPALAALPAPGTAAASVPWVPVVVVAVGAGLGWWLHRRLPRTGPGRGVTSAAATAVLASLVAAGAVGLLALASSGSVGPGRMSVLGPQAGAVALAVAIELLIGSVVVVVLGHRATHRLARRLAGGARSRAGTLARSARPSAGEPQIDPSPEG